MCELNRIKVGNFSIDQAVSMKQFKEGNFSCITIEELFHEKPEILLEKQKLKPLLNGVKLTMGKPDGVYRIYCNQQFIGLGTVDKGLLKRDIIIQM